MIFQGMLIVERKYNYIFFWFLFEIDEIVYNLDERYLGGLRYRKYQRLPVSNSTTASETS
jgi:hypothetical protein